MLLISNCKNCKHKGYCTLESVVNASFVNSWPGNITMQCKHFKSADGYETLFSTFLEDTIDGQPDCKCSCEFYKYCKYITLGETRGEYDKVLRTVRYINENYSESLHLTFTCPSLTKTQERIQRDKMEAEKYAN